MAHCSALGAEKYRGCVAERRHQVVDLKITEASSRPHLTSWPYKTKSVHGKLTLPSKNEVSGSLPEIMYSKTGPFKLMN